MDVRVSERIQVRADWNEEVQPRSISAKYGPVDSRHLMSNQIRCRYQYRGGAQKVDVVTDRKVRDDLPESELNEYKVLRAAADFLKLDFAKGEERLVFWTHRSCEH